MSFEELVHSKMDTNCLIQLNERQLSNKTIKSHLGF